MIKTNEEVLSLSNIAGGGAIERFDLELKDIWNNILDPNTDATAKRER